MVREMAMVESGDKNKYFLDIAKEAMDIIVILKSFALKVLNKL